MRGVAHEAVQGNFSFFKILDRGLYIDLYSFCLIFMMSKKAYQKRGGKKCQRNV